MDTSQRVVDFYMGANSPTGFQSFYNELEKPVDGFRSFLIKGGAGTGKSSVMKRICSECGKTESLVERIHCSSDPNSLDGLLLYDKRISVVDATPPHVIEPMYPGGYQTVINICEFLDEQKLSYRLGKTVELQTKNNELHKKCCNLLNCANILLADNYQYISRHTDFRKIYSLSKRIIAKEIPVKSGEVGVEHKRLLSAITNQGVKAFSNTITVLADKIYLLKDEYGVASNAILSTLKTAFIEKGYEIYSCYCPLNQKTKIEHLFVPELKLGFVTSNKYNDFSEIKPNAVISFTRFIDAKEIRNKKQYLGFNKRAASELITAAVDTLKQAKVIHDDLELQYCDAVNFVGVDKKTEEVIEKINKRSNILF